MNPFLLTLFICAAIAGLIWGMTRGKQYAAFFLGAAVPIFIISALGHFELLHRYEDPVRVETAGYCDGIKDEVERDLRFDRSLAERQTHGHRFHVDLIFCASLRRDRVVAKTQLEAFGDAEARYRDSGSPDDVRAMGAAAAAIAAMPMRDEVDF